MAIARTHILVCGGTGCSSSNSQALIDELNKELAEKGLAGEVQVIKTGCFGLCALGPVVVVYHEGCFYSRVKLERSLLEEKKQELELRRKSPVPTEDRAKELVKRFMDSAFASRELLVSLIDRIELTEEKQVIIKFRFAELDEVG